MAEEDRGRPITDDTISDDAISDDTISDDAISDDTISDDARSSSPGTQGYAGREPPAGKAWGGCGIGLYI